MEKTTLVHVKRNVNVANKILESQGKKLRLKIVGAYGKHQVANEDESHNFSPLLSTGKLYMWISAFIEGLEAE